MRSKNCNGKKLSFALIASLFACFVFVFGATLALGVFGDINVDSSEQTANVAEATVYSEGGNTAISLGDTSALAFGFPGTNASKTSWTKTYSLTGISFDKSGTGNVSFYRNEDDNKTFTTTASGNVYSIKCNSYITGDGNTYTAFNIDLGDFIRKLASNTQYTITVAIDCDVSYDELGYYGSHNDGLTAAPTDLLASECIKPSSNSVTLSSANTHVAFFTYWTCKLQTTGKRPGCTVTAKSITITINLSNTTYNESTHKEDGGNPIVSSSMTNLANTYVNGKGSTSTATGTGCEPYITSVNSSLWPVYDQDLESILAANLDSMSNGSGVMQSYTNKAIGTINSKNYYKYSQVEYVDTYNYYNSESLQTLLESLSTSSPILTLSQTQTVAGAGNKYLSAYNPVTWGTTNANYCSGIKSVQLGDTLINCYSASAGAEILIDSDPVGYAYVRKLDNGRVVVQTYMYKNANVTTIVKDFGEGYCSTTVQYKGIDPDAPSSIAMPSFSTDDEVLSTSTTLTKWVRTKTLTVEVDDNIPDSETDSATYTPYVWFYTVKKSNASAASIPAYDTFSSYGGTNGIKAKGLRPIAVTNFNSFVYNFEDGTAEGIKIGSQISGGTACTGAGYYRFTFYVCDLAGNIMAGDPVSFYVMVDYETPYATTTLITDNSEAITSANNGKWSTTGETLKVNLIKKNISGNTLQFDTNDGTSTLIIQNDSIVSLNGVAVNSNVIASTQIMGLVNIVNIAIHVESDGAGGTNIIFIIPSSALFAWETSFVMYAGTTIIEYDNLSTNVDEVLFDATSFEKSSVVYQGINFTSPIKVYIDNTAPVIPETSDIDGVGYLKTVADKDALALDLSASRIWFTKDTLKMDSLLSFADSAVDTDFASDLKVYYGVKTIANVSSFDSVKSFITQYLAGTMSFATNAYTSYFDRTATFTGDKIDGSETEISIDFMQNYGANMRVLVLWAVDQAGNKSSNVKIYYVLADPNTYSVKSSLFANAVLGSTAQLTLTNADEVTSNSFVRGETITMTFTLNDGYVPYQLTKIGSASTLLLQNNTANIDWTVQEGFEGIIKKESTDAGTIVMSYVYDDMSTLSALDKIVTLELKHRMVVGYTITNTSVRYTGNPAVVPMTYTDSRSEEAFNFKFRMKNTAEQLSTAPTIPGEYQVLVYIDADDPTFVTDDVETVQYKDFTITNGIAIVKAVPTTSYYGDTPTLKYSVEGIDSETLETMKAAGSSVFRGSLKLNPTSTSMVGTPYSTWKVGKYAIIQNEEFYIQYYNVTFEGDYHEILQKIIKVNILDGTKEYGSTDGMYSFSVDYSQVVSVTILNELLGMSFKSKDDSTQIAIYETADFISRELGETVGEYAFINNPSAFAISNENYTIDIETLGKYTITQKTIVLDASGQSYTFKDDTDAQNATLLAAIAINYSLGSNTQFADEIVGSLALGSQISKVDGSGSYLYVYKYKITIGTIKDTTNLHFVLLNTEGSDEFIIYVAIPNAVIISLKSTETFEMTYGQSFSAAMVDFDSHSSKFDVVGAILETDFDSIEWTLENAGLSDPYPSVGSYLLTATSAVLKKQGAAVSKIGDTAITVVVIPFQITVVPAEIVIKPVAINERKEYASSDKDYEIGIEIISIAGNNIFDGNTRVVNNYAGSTINVIKGYVNGLFSRAIYDSANNFVAFGSKNDGASDENGVVLGGTNYYSFGVYKQFTSNNDNFVVTAQIDKADRLIIDPAKITIAASDFKGVSKVYDGNTLVKYPAGETAIDINGRIKVATDDVQVTYVANYALFNSDILDASVGQKKIIFSSLGLSGTHQYNYVLYFENDSHVTVPVDSSTKIEIYSLVPGSSAVADYILITKGNISLIRSDFTIAKEYDNLTTLTKDAVSIVNRNDSNGNGTAILYNSQSSMQVLYGEFPDKEVSKNYAVDLLLFFPLGSDASVESIKIAQTDNTIEVTIEEIGGVLGVRVYMQGIGAEIKKRVLGVEDFETIKAVDRDYNSTPNITFGYTLKAGSLATGDEDYYKNDLIVISGHTKDNEVNVGKYDAIFGSYSIENTTFQKRYMVDIEELNNYYSGIRQLQVNIDYAKLMPRVEFVSRVYSGSTNYTIPSKNVINKASADVTELKTLNYSEELVTELQAFSYDESVVKYAYSKNGANDGNVQVDKDGNVVLHNVSVTGMVITETGSNNYLKNYILYGHRYNTTSEEYELVGAITSGAAIDKYEMLEVAGLTKRDLQIKVNDIDVSNKVYDGTKNASITVQLTGSNAISEDKEFLEVIATATYSRKQVGDRINVTVRVSKLVVKSEYEDSKAYLVNNYQLTAFTQKVQRSIMARPIDFSVAFNTRVYNGEESIAKNLIKYDLSSMLGDDSSNYSVNTEKGAYYLTKDINYTNYVKVLATDEYDETLTYYNEAKAIIAVDADTFQDKVALGLYIDGFELLSKVGTAYNPILNNSKEKYINYELSTKSETLLLNKDFFAYETKDGEIYYGTDCLVKVLSTDSFVEGRTYYNENKEKVSLNNTVFEENKATSNWYYITNDAKYFYYELPSTDKYISVDNYNALDNSAKATYDSSIIGFYIYYNSITTTNVKVYLLDSSFAGTCEQMANPVTYVIGEGKVDRREVSVTAVSIKNSNSLTKEYDGTTKYYGENGIDFEFGSGAIANDIPTDNLDVAEVSANYKTAQAGATQVVFIATGLATKPGYTDYSYNYSSTSATSTNKQAIITKRKIYVTLADNEIIYGSQLSSVKGNMSYYLDEALTKQIVVNSNGWFVNFVDFVEACGLDVNKTSPNYIGDEYVEQLRAQRYNSSFEKQESGDYYKLAGTFTEPVIDIAVSGTKQPVGYVAEKYGLKGGNATNFTFVPKYTGNGKNSYSKLVVTKKTIYVVADSSKEYSRIYGTDLSKDAVKLLFLNENGKEGIVSGETSNDIYTGLLEVEFRKVLVTDLANLGLAPAVTARSLINETVEGNQGLEDGYIYVAYIKATDFESKNYNVVFGSVELVDSKLKYQFAGTEFTYTVPQLTIVLPEIEGVSLSSTSKELTYNGEERAKELVSGLTSNDTVTIEGSDAKNVKVNASNEAIAYEGDVIVERTLLKNENEICYIITKNLGTASLLINKASAGLTASKQTVQYDGNKHEVSSTSYGVSDANIGVNPTSYTIEYYLDGEKVDTTKKSIINAGTYTYKVILDSPNTNYISEEKTAQFVVAPATVEITVDTSKLMQEYVETKEYTIIYEVGANTLGITKFDTQFKFYRKGEETTVTKAGRYNFVIYLTDEKDKEFNIRSNDPKVADIVNVVFVNNEGNLDLTVSQIDSFDKEENKVANITLLNKGDSLLAEEFITRYVYQNNVLAEDDLYWASVNQYMSMISSTIGAGATLEAIIRMDLTYGVNHQTLNNKEAVVTVSLPKEIDSLDGYAIYTSNSSGNLIQLKPSEYTVNSDGTITYTTKYLGSLVFVKLGDQPMSTGAAVGIGVGVTAFVLLIAASVVITVLKKKKLKSLVE